MHLLIRPALYTRTNPRFKQSEDKTVQYDFIFFFLSKLTRLSLFFIVPYVRLKLKTYGRELVVCLIRSLLFGSQHRLAQIVFLG